MYNFSQPKPGYGLQGWSAHWATLHSVPQPCRIKTVEHFSCAEGRWRGARYLCKPAWTAPQVPHYVILRMGNRKAEGLSNGQRSRSLARHSHAHRFANIQLSPQPWFPPSLDGLLEGGKKANLLPNSAQVNRTNLFS